MMLSPAVSRKSLSSGVSIGPGQTEFIRTPRRIAVHDSRIVYRTTTSFEKLYRAVREVANVVGEPLQRRRPTVIDPEIDQCIDRVDTRTPPPVPPAIDAVLTIAPAFGHPIEHRLAERAQREVVHGEHGVRRLRVGDTHVVEQCVYRIVDLSDHAHVGLFVTEIDGDVRVRGGRPDA